MKPQAFIFIGRYGAGKGTQGRLLQKFLESKQPSQSVLYIETGAEFRRFNEGDSYTSQLGKTIVDKGGLMPVFMPIYLWASILVDKYNGMQQLIFDGTPRKLMETKILDSIFSFYSLGKPWILYLDVEHEESHKRLKLRALSGGRPDDGAIEMENRRVAYEADVIPTVEYYRTNPSVNFLDIDGHRSIEEIHADIVKRLGLE